MRTTEFDLEISEDHAHLIKFIEEIQGIDFKSARTHDGQEVK